MSDAAAALDSNLPRKGDFTTPTTDALRSLCPMVNCLANHGYLPRDGHEVRVDHFLEAMNAVGLSSALAALLSRPIFLEFADDEIATDQDLTANANADVAGRSQNSSILHHLAYFIRNPWAILFSSFGMRRRNQRDSNGHKCLDLDQLARHNAIEHDISLSRHDLAQGDNLKRQPELIQEILSASSDGVLITINDFATLRKRRNAEQKKANPEAKYGKLQHQLACGEIALMLHVLGDTRSVRVDFIKSFYFEERLPIEEGWKKRTGLGSVGLLELNRTVELVKKTIGLDIE